MADSSEERSLIQISDAELDQLIVQSFRNQVYVEVVSRGIADIHQVYAAAFDLGYIIIGKN